MRREPDSWDDLVGAEIYAETVREGTLYTRLAADLVELLAPESGECFLDVAAGSGLVSRELERQLRGTGLVVGFDGAPAMAQVARRELPGEQTAFLAAEPTALPLGDGLFDGASCSAALWHFPALGRFFRELARVLRPSGRLAFNVPASQLRDIEDLPPAPIQLLLAQRGERRFGASPQPAGPEQHSEDILSLAQDASLSPIETRLADVSVCQQELLDLLAVPAISARFYPDQSEEQREEWLAEVARRIDPDEGLRVRWWEVLLRARPCSS